MEKYYENLYMQYCAAFGMDYNGFDENDKYFWIWANELLKRTKTYTDYIKFLNIELSCDKSIELNKGKYDSLGKDLVMVVSPYAETMHLENRKLVLYNGKPNMIINDESYSVFDIGIYLTQNPFSYNDIDKLLTLHNKNNDNVCIGIHGSIYDKDRQKKSQILKDIYHCFSGEAKFNLDEDHENYFGCITTNRKIKKLVLTSDLKKRTK